MSITVLEKIQPQMSLILEEQPDIKQEVQKTLREAVETTPIFNSIDELLDWKIDIWEKQLETDTRIQALWNVLSQDDIDNFYDTIILNPYIPVVPYLSQLLLLFSKGSVLFGGARGGGKSEACLIGALQYVEFPEYKAGIFRLTFSDLSVPGAIMDRALSWLKDNPLLKKEGIAPHWDGQKNTFTFSSGAKIMFGHVQHEKDAENYQGSEFHHLIFDEAVQFSVNKITRIKGSNRKKFTSFIPLRIWYTGNPGGLSHEYFKENFIDNNSNFIDSKYTDNPYLDQVAYESIFKDIEDSDPILYRQWKYGDWEALPEGLMFKRKWFLDCTYDFIPKHETIIKAVRFWDMAATLEEDPNKQGGADWTAGALLLLGKSGVVYLDDMRMFREDPYETEENIVDQARLDTSKVILRVEQEGGGQAKIYVHNTLARKFPGYDYEGVSSKLSKIDRAKTMVSFIKSGNLKMKVSSWNTQFLNLICSFPTKGVHDDPVDALSGAFKELFNLDDGEKVEPVSYIGVSS